jgi:hypothetical protein
MQLKPGGGRNLRRRESAGELRTKITPMKGDQLRNLIRSGLRRENGAWALA